MDRIVFTVNGNKCSVGPEVDSDVSLNDYLRNYLNLRGTKYMCKEGGCGACIVHAKVPTTGRHTKSLSVNSCLVSVTSCDGWAITTIEGLGDRRKGYHPVQKTLAEYNGTQCGYCSPGWVMSMFSLLESNDYKLTQYEIEDSFGSNVCRCTGYRPILDAFKSFAKDAPKPSVPDIEDLKLCKGKDECKKKCENEWCIVSKNDVEGMKKIHLKDDRVWYRVTEIKHIFEIFEKEGTESYMLVNGNTGRGAVPIFAFPRVLIDIKPVEELKICLVDQNLVIGSGTTLTELLEIFKNISEEKEEFFYLKKLYEHINLVAHIAVRNVSAVPIFAFPRVLIDIKPVEELKICLVDQNLVIGSGTTLTELLEIFKNISEEKEEFFYLKKLYEHINLVAHIAVRNVASIAGNLMTKHREPTFSSDIFLLFECIGAMLTIVDKSTKIEVTPEEFLTVDMTGKVITKVSIPPYSHNYEFVSFKVMPRSQSAHAVVNAAFLYHFDPNGPESTVQACSLVITGLSAHFVHASKTEKYLKGRKLFTNETVQGALKVLEEELVVKEIPGELGPEYRKKCALGLFYKGILNLIPKARLKPIYRSGARDFRKTRPLSKGTEVYDTNPIIWPVTEPMPKVEALIQCAGEANYVNDLPTQPREIFCAFVTSDIAVGEIESIDPTPALKLPGVLAFFSAKDIPGVNNFLSQQIQGLALPEELLADGRVKYYDQPIGIIAAETEKLANRAALLVRVKYRPDKKKPVLLLEEAKKDPARVRPFGVIPARDRGVDVQRVLKGSDNIFGQYFFCMETLSTVTLPSDDGMDVFPATQWTDCTQLGIAQVLDIESNRLNIEVARLGGAYGIKITRATQVSAACALVTHYLHRPCRFVMSIQANMRIVGKRLPCTRDFEMGINNNGEIQYLTFNLYDDHGFINSDVILVFGISAVKNCYDNRRWQTQLFDVLTDTASNTYCRAPGALECIAMTEMIMERISYAIDKDPFEVRLNNLNSQYTDVAEMTQTLIRDSEYNKRKEEVEEFNKLNRWKKKGLRVALLSWPVSTVIEFNVLLSVYHGDATVVVKHGGVEIGQGINTKVIQAVAYTLNIPMSKVKVKPTDTVSNPNCFSTGGSRTTQAVCFGVIKCCQLLLDRLQVVRDTLTNPTWELLIRQAYIRGINLQTSYKVTNNDQSPYRSGGAVVVETELDILTGEHEILRVDLIEDVGTSLNPELDIGQIEGAFMMGIGYWTHEHLIYDQKTGELLTDRTWYYHVPLAKDIPIDFRIQLRRNSYNPVGTLGAKAVAEPPTCLAIAVAFALRAAIASSREDSGYDRKEWFTVDGPFTLEANVLKADVKLEEFLLY